MADDAAPERGSPPRPHAHNPPPSHTLLPLSSRHDGQYPLDPTRPVSVDVALVLAVDVSNSVDWSEYELQRTGLSHAIHDAGVIEAISAGHNGRIAIAIVQWSGKRTRRLAVNWTVLSDQASADAFSRVIKFMPREFSGDTTNISGVLSFATELLAKAPFTAVRKVIDISGDGPENVVASPQTMRDEAVAAGITVNGLAIENEEPNLRQHYRDARDRRPWRLRPADQALRRFCSGHEEKAHPRDRSAQNEFQRTQAHCVAALKELPHGHTRIEPSRNDARCARATPHPSPRSPASSRGRIHQNAISATSISADTLANASPHAIGDAPPLRSSMNPISSGPTKPPA